MQKRAGAWGNPNVNISCTSHLKVVSRTEVYYEYIYTEIIPYILTTGLVHILLAIHANVPYPINITVFILWPHILDINKFHVRFVMNTDFYKSRYNVQ